jgi:hypothetical protein
MSECEQPRIRPKVNLEARLRGTVACSHSGLIRSMPFSLGLSYHYEKGLARLAATYEIHFWSILDLWTRAPTCSRYKILTLQRSRADVVAKLELNWAS